MAFIVYTDRFVTPVYFMEHKGRGFSITTDIDQAKTYRTLAEATTAAEWLSRESGFKTLTQKQKA